MRTLILLSFAAMLGPIAACSGPADTGLSTGNGTSGNGSTTGGSATSAGSTGLGTTGTASTSTSGTTGSSTMVTGLAPFPVVPKNDGTILPAPELVVISYADDSLAAGLVAFEQWLMTEWVPMVGAEFGVHSGTLVGHMVLDAGAPATLTDQQIQDLIAYLALDAGVIPIANSNTVYAFYVPQATIATLYPGDPNDCVRFWGYHDETVFTDGDPQTEFQAPYVVDVECANGPDAINAIEALMSHEVIEAATDPSPTYGYQIFDPQDPWSYFSGEVGDLCEFSPRFFSDAGFVTERVWSNLAAADGGHSPCVPGDDYEVLRPLAADEKHASVPVGGSATFHLTAWATASGSANQDNWDVVAGGFAPPLLCTHESDGGLYCLLGSFVPTVALSSSATAAGGQVDLTVTVPAGVDAGELGVVGLYSTNQADTTYLSLWLMGVQAN